MRITSVNEAETQNIGYKETKKIIRLWLPDLLLVVEYTYFGCEKPKQTLDKTDLF
jgi:hypothetical protein